MTTPQATTDEFYSFPGDREFRKHPYWVARHGRTVTSQVEDGEARRFECATVDDARALFAEETCEPNGPGAPMPFDVIRIVYGPSVDERFTVESVVTVTHDGYPAFGVTGNRSGRPLRLVLGQYEILSRPAA